MSQTSFLESVVAWNETQCRENLQQALPKLVLAETNVSEEELGICKIICELFLPWVKFKDVEKMVFIHITAKTCSIMDKVLEGINDLCRQTSVQADLNSLLEMFVEVLDCYSACFKYVQVEGGNSPNICDVHSLPYGAVHLLKGAYSHCKVLQRNSYGRERRNFTTMFSKESGNIYGEFLPGVTELLSALFKKAHGLQMALLSMLEKISMDGQVTEDEAQDLCFICQGLFEVCQTVTSLDAKLVCSLWKTISRFSGRHSNFVKNDLDVDRMVIFLCEEIKSGYLYLFQLAPPIVESTEMSLSQGDSAAFQKSLKVLSYQMRIMISLLDNFVDYVNQCEYNVFQLIICIYRNLPPCLEAPNVSEMYIAEIQRQIVNGTEPLLNLLIRKQHFMECITSDEKDLLSTEDEFSLLVVLVKIFDLLPKQNENIIDKWTSPKLYTGDVRRDGLFDCMFKAIDNCYVEMSLLSPEAVTLITDKTKSTSLYEYVCTHVCGLVGCLRARHFDVLSLFLSLSEMLEQCLISHLFSQNIYVSTLATDVWCFMARFGSADLCFKQTILLLELCARSELQCTEFNLPIYNLTRRLVKFVAPKHHVKLLKNFPVEQNSWLYRIIPASAFQEQYRDMNIDKLINMFNSSTQQILKNEDAPLEHVEYLVYIVQSLNNCLSDTDSQGDILAQYGCTLGSSVEQIFATWDKDWMTIPILKTCFVELLHTLGFCLQFITADLLMKVFDQLTDTVTSAACDSQIKFAAVQFLNTCRKFRFPPNAQQSQILKKIPQLFQKLLKDKDVLVYHGGLEAFTQFAESTPHEDIVPMCLQNSQELQDAVVSFLNKRPYLDNKLGQREFLKEQHKMIREHKNVVPDLHDVTSKAEDIQAVKDSCKTGDMLDDITCGEEPSLKRKRLTDMQENATQVDDVIDCLEKNLDDLDTVSIASLTSENVKKLRRLHTRLKTFLDS